MTARFLRVGAIVVSVASFAAGACGAATHRASYPAAVHAREFVLGRSVEGRWIVAHVVGSPSAPRRILLVGCVHGNERAGEAITRRLRTVTPPAGSALWLVDEFNPDGCLRGTRQNAHGVDLNRNSPWHWRPLEQPGGTFYSGIAPLSEPESRAIHALVARLRPEISIWYHQHASLVDDSSGGSSAIEGRYARAVGLRLRSYGTFPGSITSWQNSAYPRDTAFVVELPAGALPASSVARHVAAILTLAARPS